MLPTAGSSATKADFHAVKIRTAAGVGKEPLKLTRQKQETIGNPTELTGQRFRIACIRQQEDQEAGELAKVVAESPLDNLLRRDVLSEN